MANTGGSVSELQGSLMSTTTTNDTTNGEILVRFYTNHEEYRIPSEPIAVPANINRVGLGAIIGHLLGKGKLINIEI